MEKSAMIKICFFGVKHFFCFNLLLIFYSYFSEGFDSDVSLFCFCSISGIAPLITCFDLQFKNTFKKFITSLIYSSYSALQILLQIFLLFNFLSVIRNLTTVNVLRSSLENTSNNTTRDNTRQHEYNTRQHVYNTAQHEYNTTQHELTQQNISL